MSRILSLIESVKDLKALFIGETIIDEYVFVTPLAKPSKENILAVRFQEAHQWEGGVLAAAQHAADFCVTQSLTTDAHIKKTRYVEENYKRKLFEVQSIDDSGLSEPLTDLDADVIVATDFGHGLFSPAIVHQVCSSGKYLAVATQTNAHNAGFNLITKYPRADYICIDEPEARLAAADRTSPIEDVMRKLAKDRCDKMIVTHGKHGAYGLHGDRFLHLPAVGNQVVDTMGAGDAFFAVTAIMAKDGDIEDLLTIGNAAGALKTQILGHQKSITKQALIDYLRTNGTC